METSHLFGGQRIRAPNASIAVVSSTRFGGVLKSSVTSMSLILTILSVGICHGKSRPPSTSFKTQVLQTGRPRRNVPESYIAYTFMFQVFFPLEKNHCI